MSDIKELHLLEQHEAMQIDSNKKLEEFKSTLPDLQKEAMTKTQEYIVWMEKNKIPAIVFVKVFDKGFHQFNTLIEPHNPIRYSVDFNKKASNTIWQGNWAMIHAIAGADKEIRVSIVDPKDSKIIMDTHVSPTE